MSQLDPQSLDHAFLQLALEEARLAANHGDVPIGAVLVKDGKVLAQAHNERELSKNPTAHAEVLALERAAQAHGHWNLTGSKLYVTLEPCVMCAGSILMARVEELVYSATDPKGGCLSLGISIFDNAKLNHRVRVRQGPLQEEAAELLRAFFRELRKQPGKN